MILLKTEKKHMQKFNPLLTNTKTKFGFLLKNIPNIPTCAINIVIPSEPEGGIILYSSSPSSSLPYGIAFSTCVPYPYPRRIFSANIFMLIKTSWYLDKDDLLVNFSKISGAATKSPIKTIKIGTKNKIGLVTIKYFLK